jgi:hypothetical protein
VPHKQLWMELTEERRIEVKGLQFDALVSAWDIPDQDQDAAPVLGGNNNVAVSVAYDWPC